MYGGLFLVDSNSRESCTIQIIVWVNSGHYSVEASDFISNTWIPPSDNWHFQFCNDGIVLTVDSSCLAHAPIYKLRPQETMCLTDNVRLTSGIIVATPSMRKHVIAKRVIVNVEQMTRTEMTSAQMSDNSIFLHESVIRGHHIFKGIWTPRTGEIVQVRQEAGNPHDRNAVALLKLPME